MFTRFKCGCVGIHVKGEKAIIIDACDTDRDVPINSLSWFWRNVSDEEMTPLDEQREARMHERLAWRLAKADRFDDMRHALGVPDDQYAIGVPADAAPRKTN